MKMLFIDDYHIHSCEGVRRTFHKLERYTDGPVCQLTGPGEGWFLHGSYERDPQSGDLVLWYKSITRGGWKNLADGMRRGEPDYNFLCQARSTDGIHWEKLSLGLYQYQESYDNNICMVNYSFSGLTNRPHGMKSVDIRRDPLDPDTAAQYKAVMYRSSRDPAPVESQPLKSRRDVPFPSGVYLTHSPDGIHWPKIERLAFYLADGYGDTISFAVDTLRRGYIFCGKTVEYLADGTYTRLRCHSFSPHWANWPKPQPVLSLLPYDGAQDQTYEHHVFVYGDMYLGFLRMLHGDSGFTTIQLIYSRDGVVWERPKEGFNILPLGEGTAWDSGMQLMFNSPPVLVNNRLYFYYVAHPQPHRGFGVPKNVPSEDYRPPGPWLATLRVDGFASLDAEEEGQVVTQALELRHPSIRINVNASRGLCRVGLLDLLGRPYPGFSVDECDPVNEDVLERPITWRGQSCHSLMYRPVRLDIRLSQAQLYSVEGY